MLLGRQEAGSKNIRLYALVGAMGFPAPRLMRVIDSKWITGEWLIRG